MLIRPSSKPRGEIECRAARAIDDNGGPTLSRVFYKYDCAGCDRRVTVREPNVLPARARCGACGAWTVIAAAGFMLHSRVATDVQWDEPALYFAKVYALLPDAAVSAEWEP